MPKRNLKKILLFIKIFFYVFTLRVEKNPKYLTAISLKKILNSNDTEFKTGVEEILRGSDNYLKKELTNIYINKLFNKKFFDYFRNSLKNIFEKELKANLNRNKGSLNTNSTIYIVSRTMRKRVKIQWVIYAIVIFVLVLLMVLMIYYGVILSLINEKIFIGILFEGIGFSTLVLLIFYLVKGFRINNRETAKADVISASLEERWDNCKRIEDLNKRNSEMQKIVKETMNYLNELK